MSANRLAFGELVSQEFRNAVYRICARNKWSSDHANWLMACMAWESNETFSPSIKNMAGSGATGLIQFMPATARGLGTTTEELAKMTAEKQLVYVENYFKPYASRIKSLSDTYMAILWPAAIGMPENSPLWDRESRPTTYRQNAGLDIDKDGTITKAEAASKVQAKLNRGLKDGLAYVVRY